MAIKIYISPSSQYGNPYSYGGTNEGDTMYSLGQKVEAKLSAAGFQTMLEGKGLSISQRAASSNAFGADLHLCLHTNAGGGHGTVMFTWRNLGKPYAVAIAVGEAVASITKSGKLDIRSNPDLYEIRGTQAVCCYCESEFHDNAEGAKWILDNLDSLATQIVKGICSYFSVNYNPSTDSTSILYRVQVGAYIVKGNAEAKLSALKDQGYDCFIVEANGMYKVQCGAFTVRANAENRRDELIMKGHEAFILEVRQ